MFLKICTVCAGLLLTFFLTFTPANAGDNPAQNTPDISGDWVGSLKTPQGSLTLILTVKKDKNGKPQAVLESPDQAPGQKIPVSRILVSGGELSFTIQALGASYRGKWQPAGQQWGGTFTQGIDLPLIFKRGKAPTKPVIHGLDGNWQATLPRNGVDLRLILHIKTGRNGTLVTLDSPDMMAYSLPVSGFSRRDHIVSFKVVAAAVHFKGRLSEDNSSLKGVWSRQGQVETGVTFVRFRETADVQDRKRPQLPKEPFNYTVEEVFIPNPQVEDVTLAGTLTLPQGKGPFPAVVLISGSGPQDRDETFMGHKPFFVLADHLTKQGITVLRYDDRGFGASTGVFGSANSKDFASDATAVVGFLKTRPEIKQNAIGLVGHSEGGLIASIATPGNKDIGFIILLAAPGTDTIRLSHSQRRLLGRSQGVLEKDIERATPVIDKMLKMVATATGKADVEKKLNALLTPDMLKALGAGEDRRDYLIQQYSSNWYRYFLKYDPADFLPRIEVPVLALNGALDQQVPATENLKGIEAALKHNRDATIQRLEGLNHLFQTAKTGTLGEYGDLEETFAPLALHMISDWINTRF